MSFSEDLCCFLRFIQCLKFLIYTPSHDQGARKNDRGGSETERFVLKSFVRECFRRFHVIANIHNIIRSDSDALCLQTCLRTQAEGRLAYSARAFRSQESQDCRMKNIQNIYHSSNSYAHVTYACGMGTFVWKETCVCTL